MKNLKLTLIAIVAAGVVLSGCSSKDSRSQPAPEQPNNVVPSPTPSSPATPSVSPSPGSHANCGKAAPTSYWSQGGTAKFTPESTQVFEEYLGRSVNDPCNMQINLDARNVMASGQPAAFNGTIRIGYNDDDGTGNDKFYEGFFRSSTTGNTAYDVRFNTWYTHGGQNYFKSFYQDQWGAIVLIVDSYQDEDKMNGEIWFYNFDFSVCRDYWPYVCNTQSSEKMCWDISGGPYNCQDFLVDNKVRPDQVVYPNAKFKRLGRFEGLSKARALK